MRSEMAQTATAAPEPAFADRLRKGILGDRTAGEFLMDQRAFVALIVLVIVFSLLSDAFLTPTNMILMTKHVAYNAILALGMLLVIITGGIDLSVGSTVGLSGIVAGVLLQGWELSLFDATAYPAVWVVIVIALAVGGLVGALNGWLITRFNVARFIATLGTLYMARGAALLISNGATFPRLQGEVEAWQHGLLVPGRRTPAQVSPPRSGSW